MKKVIIAAAAVLFSMNVYASGGDDGTLIIDPMKCCDFIKIGAKSNQEELNILSLTIVDLLQPENYNEILSPNNCNEFNSSCTYSASKENLESGKVYVLSMVLSDNSIVQKSFLYQN